MGAAAEMRLLRDCLQGNADRRRLGCDGCEGSWNGVALMVMVLVCLALALSFSLALAVLIQRLEGDPEQDG